MAHRNPMTAKQKTAVLITDDDQGMRDTIGAILKRDYRADGLERRSGARIAEARGHRFDALDVPLPGINGLDVLRIVKENQSHRNIMISAVTEIEVAVQA